MLKAQLNNPRNPTFILLAITHGTSMQKKLLEKQLEKNKTKKEDIVQLIPWEDVEDFIDLKAEERKREEVLSRLNPTEEISYPILERDEELDANDRDKDISQFIINYIDKLFLDNPDKKLGIICDANLGNNGKPMMRTVVKDSIANHKRVDALTLFTGTPTCQTEATTWARLSPNQLEDEMTDEDRPLKKYLLFEDEEVSNQAGKLKMVTLLIKKLNDSVNIPNNRINSSALILKNLSIEPSNPSTILRHSLAEENGVQSLHEEALELKRNAPGVCQHSWNLKLFSTAP